MSTRRLYKQTWYRKNKTTHYAKGQAWRKAHPDKVRSGVYMGTYGITLEQYDLLLQQQNGVCAICKQPETIIHPATGCLKRLSVDHNHETKQIRGLLCDSCNRGIGVLKENITTFKSAIKYLRNF